MHSHKAPVENRVSNPNMMNYSSGGEIQKSHPLALVRKNSSHLTSAAKMTNVLSVWIYCLSLGEQYLYYLVRGGNKARIQKSSPSRAWKTLWSVRTCSRSHSVQELWIKPVTQTGSTLINTEKCHNKNKSLNQGRHWGLVLTLQKRRGSRRVSFGGMYFWYML